eukprot:TRINITY_DN230_c0_g2_i2.p1 TRINITY_DN230_c0_g2~~TRINITY_DN230_c0_g2_i2.p1  ORF type:complete len:460 (+),score=71.74 TRINITY_DN230_c0_g2_i2:1193-2572(+)
MQFITKKLRKLRGTGEGAVSYEESRDKEQTSLALPRNVDFVAKLAVGDDICRLQNEKYQQFNAAHSDVQVYLVGPRSTTQIANTRYSVLSMPTRMVDTSELVAQEREFRKHSLYFERFNVDGMTYFVRLYIDGGSLESKLEKSPDGLGEAVAVTVLAGVVSSALSMHKNKIAHGNITPKYLLLLPTGLFFLAEAENANQRNHVTTTFHCSPSGQGNQRKSRGGDIRQMGQLACVTATGVTPETIQGIPDALCGLLRDFVEKTICPFDERLTMDQVESHPCIYHQLNVLRARETLTNLDADLEEVRADVLMRNICEVSRAMEALPGVPGLETLLHVLVGNVYVFFNPAGEELKLIRHMASRLVLAHTDIGLVPEDQTETLKDMVKGEALELATAKDEAVELENKLETEEARRLQSEANLTKSRNELRELTLKSRNDLEELSLKSMALVSGVQAACLHFEK